MEVNVPTLKEKIEASNALQVCKFNLHNIAGWYFAFKLSRIAFSAINFIFLNVTGCEKLCPKSENKILQNKPAYKIENLHEKYFFFER